MNLNNLTHDVANSIWNCFLNSIGNSACKVVKHPIYYNTKKFMWKDEYYYVWGSVRNFIGSNYESN
jgi:hypothetical protein